MKRAAFKMKLKAGYEKEYKKRHDEIWPELKEKLSRAGIYNYSIFLDKEILPASGDKHDYMSRAIYLWPSENPNEKVWVAKDGKINKESLEKTDHNNYYQMLDAIKTLSLAYHFDGNKDFARKSVQLIKEWFIDEKTKLNPNFNFAQAIPGKSDGSMTGVIDSRGIVWVIESLKLVENTEYWTKTDSSKFNDWCESFLDLLLDSRTHSQMLDH